RRLGPHDHLPAGGIEAQHVERRRAGDAETAALPYGEMDHARMAPEDPSIEIDDLPRLRRAGREAPDHGGIAALRHEADVLAVGLGGHRQPESQDICFVPEGRY